LPQLGSFDITTQRELNHARLDLAMCVMTASIAARSVATQIKSAKRPQRRDILSPMKTLLMACAVVALACAPLHAQRIPPRFYSVCNTDMGRINEDRSPIVKKDAKTAIHDMNAALNDLVVYQAKYFVDHHTYTIDEYPLGISASKSGQQSVQTVCAGDRWWTATAIDRSLKGKSCVIYVGDAKELPYGIPKTTRAGLVAKGEGIPTCDEP
jgi:hypothetical protein